MYPRVFGKYILERELARGGMARVLLATLRGAGGFEKRLVVKQIRDELAFDQQFVQRFVEEAKTTVALSHPNIVPVYELGVEQGTYFLAMELVEGVSIAELLRGRDRTGARRVLTPEEGAYVGMEVCRALEYAHRRMKVVHRDITPRNVMIDEEGQIKLIDFGIAAPALVAGHEIFGSPGHMPPEQVEGGELGPPTDIFALAVLLMEAWTGSAPFRRPTPDECDAAMRAPHPKPSTFDPRLAPLDDAIGRAMMSDPRARQKEASELGRELRSYLRGVDIADVARALGDRVRDLREVASSPSPPSEKAASAARATQPSAGELGTQTFASRGESHEWSNPPPPGKANISLDAPSTRKLAEPAPADHAKRTPSGRPRGRSDDPAMAIRTPLMVEPVGDLDAKVLAARAGAQAKAQKKEPFADDLETIATRPIETPVSAIEPMPLSAASKASSSRSAVAVAIVAIAAIAGVLTWRSRTTDVPGDQPSVPTAQSARSPTSPSTSPSTTQSAPLATASATASAFELASSTRPPITHVVAPAPSHVASSAPLVAPAGRATVVLLGDPGTKVSVDGTARGACPVRLALEPGQHEAYFTFQPTGESRGERFGLKAGDRVTVRADFTGASPSVKIQR